MGHGKLLVLVLVLVLVLLAEDQREQAERAAAAVGRLPPLLSRRPLPLPGLCASAGACTRSFGGSASIRPRRFGV